MTTRNWELIWDGDDGTTFALTEANGVTLRRGHRGLDAPPISNLTEPRLSPLGGEELIGTTTRARTLMLPLTIDVGRGNYVRQKIAALLRTLRAGGRLRYTSNSTDTSPVELRSVIYESGLEGGGGTQLAHLRQVVLTLRALDPYWYDLTPITKSFTFDGGTIGDTDTDDAAILSDDPDTPSDGGGFIPIEQDGDTSASPVFTATGPIDTLTVGIRGGSSWVMAEPLADGDTLTVDHRLTSLGPYLNGTLDWDLLTASSELFTLPATAEDIIVGATSSSGDPTLTAEWYPRREIPI